MSQLKRFTYVDPTEGEIGQTVMLYGEPGEEDKPGSGQIVSCNPGSQSAIGTLAEPAARNDVVAVELFEAAEPASSTRTTRVERQELGLYIGDVRIAPNREDGAGSTYTHVEMQRVLTMLVRFLGPNAALRLPDGRPLLSVTLPDDVGIDWGEVELAHELQRPINLGSAFLYHRPATWPTPPPKPEPEPEPYLGPMSNLIGGALR